MSTGEQFNESFLKHVMLRNFMMNGEQFANNDEIFLNERVEVAAIFAEGLNPCRPLKFRRLNGREVEITEIGLRHPSAKGSRTIHVFDVTDGGADYRLEFDSERLTWRLTMEADHYAA